MIKDLTDEDRTLLLDALDDAIDVAEGVLEMHIQDDHTPETIDEFMAVVSTAQERVNALYALYTKIGGERGD